MAVLDDFDHGILSPSGRVSNRTRKAAERKLRQAVSNAIAACPPKPQPSERQRLLWRLRDVRDWHARGMYPRKFKREIAELESRLATLPDLGESP
jgi:hypothetical protein